MDPTEISPAAVTLALGPDLTISLAASNRERLLQAVEGAAAGLSLDLENVTDIDSAGVQLLLAAQRSLGAREARLTIGRASAPVIEALRTFGLESMSRATLGGAG